MLDKAVKTGRSLTSDRGAIASEYAILVTLIALVIVAAVTAIGISTQGMFLPLLGAL